MNLFIRTAKETDHQCVRFFFCDSDMVIRKRRKYYIGNLTDVKEVSREVKNAVRKAKWKNKAVIEAHLPAGA